MSRRTPFLVLALIFSSTGALYSNESADTPVRIIGKNQTFAAYNSFSGPGSEVPGLANSFDMSFFESNLGGRQSSFNGSGITTNSIFPLTNGAAFTNNTDVGFSSRVSDELKAGFLAELYSLIGNRTVGRVFGAQSPWDNYAREEGLIQPSHFSADFYNGFLEGRHDQFSFKVLGGVLPSKDLPEFSRKEMNQVRLGSLVWRVPIANSSFFEKEDRKMIEGRQPVKGMDLTCDYEYTDGKHLHAEVFTGAIEPTPIMDLERDAYGGRASADILKGNAGFTYVYNDGLKPISGYRETQGVWSIDSSYKLADWLVPYVTFARTDYERKDTGESHAGRAFVAGLSLKCPKGYEIKGQYQKLEENYDLMAYHKTEHYPGNTQGLNIQSTLPLTDALTLKTVVYYLEQISTSTTADDTIFGDSFFSSAPGSKKGTIGVERAGGELKLTSRLSLNGYVEHAKFRKDTPLVSGNIDKDVYNFYGNITYGITQQLYVQGSFRDFFSVGNWQTMNFQSYQTISEAAVGYKVDKDHDALLMYHYINFTDNIGVAAGRNDYAGHQIILEIRTLL